MTQTKSPVAASYQRECRDALSDARKRFETLEKLQGERTAARVLEPLNDLWIVLDQTLNLAGLYRNVHPDAELRQVANECEQEMSKLVTDMGLSRPLYESVEAVPLNGQDAVTQHYVLDMLRDFRRAGVDKDESTRETIRRLKDELVLIGQDFDKNIREDVRHIVLDGPQDMAGLPQDYIDGHKAAQDGKVIITTDYPDYMPFMSYAHNDAARLALYTVFRQRGYPQNQAVLQHMLDKRYELAQLLGYANWAAYITEDKMVKSAQAASDFITKINEVATERAKKNYNELLKRLQKDHPEATSVGDWQKTYLEEIVKREEYAFDSQAARAYLPFGKVRQGLFGHRAGNVWRNLSRSVDPGVAPSGQSLRNAGRQPSHRQVLFGFASPRRQVQARRGLSYSFGHWQPSTP